MNNARIDISLPSRAAMLAAFAFAAASAPSHAVESSVSCLDLQLEQAECLPGGPDHMYVFGGSCTLTVTDKGGAFSKSYASHQPFPVEVVVRWKAKDKTLREELRILGAFEWNGQIIGGELETMYVCSQDPLVGSAACNVTDHSNDTGLAGLSAPAQKFKQPITSGQTTLSGAAKLSTKASCLSSGPTPPPPPPTPTKQAPVLKSPKKPTPRLSAAASGSGSSQVVVPAASAARVPERRPVNGRARMPDPTRNPGSLQIPDPEKNPGPPQVPGPESNPGPPNARGPETNPGPPNAPCTESLRLAPGERIALADGRSLEAPALRAAGSAASRVRLLDGNGRPLREFDAARICVDGHARVYATIGNRAQPLGRLARAGQ